MSVNKEAVLQAIRVMENAKNLDMRNFQSLAERAANTVEALHECGKTAYFAEYIKISEYFKANFNFIYSFSISSPCVEDNDGNRLSAGVTIAYILDIPVPVADAIVFGPTYRIPRKYPLIPWPVDIAFSRLTPQHIIAILQSMLDNYSDDDTFVYDS